MKPNATTRSTTVRCLLSLKHSRIGACISKDYFNPSKSLPIIATLSSGALHRTSHVVKLVGLSFWLITTSYSSINQELRMVLVMDCLVNHAIRFLMLKTTTTKSYCLPNTSIVLLPQHSISALPKFLHHRLKGASRTAWITNPLWLRPSSLSKPKDLVDSSTASLSGKSRTDSSIIRENSISLTIKSSVATSSSPVMTPLPLDILANTAL
jgi:hypothetical protein